jgi:hypothetical protein
MECQICLDAPDGVIFQCLEGHLLCAKCNDRLTSRKCPTCRDELPAKLPRNRLAENCISEQMTSCEHCKESMARQDLRNHLPCQRYENRRKSTMYNNRTEYFTGLQGDETLRKITWTNGMTQYFETDKKQKLFGQVIKEIYKMPHPEAGAKKEFGLNIDDKRTIEYAMYRSPHTMAGTYYDYSYDDGDMRVIWNDPLERVYTLPHPEAGRIERYEMLDHNIGGPRLHKTQFIHPHDRDGETIERYEFSYDGVEEHCTSKRYFEYPHIHAGLQLTLFDPGNPPYRMIQERELMPRAPGQVQVFNYVSICKMPEYQNKSFEELRYEDYVKGNKGTTPGKVCENLHISFVEPHKYLGIHFEFATTETDIACIDFNAICPLQLPPFPNS